MERIEKMDMKAFGARLRAARLHAEYNTAREFAETVTESSDVNITPSSYSTYENGTTVPPLDKAVTIARALSVSLDKLAGLEVSKSAGEVDTSEIDSNTAPEHFAPLGELDGWEEYLIRLCRLMGGKQRTVLMEDAKRLFMEEPIEDE